MLTTFIFLTVIMATLQLNGQDANYQSSKSKSGNIDFIINNSGQIGYSRDVTKSGFVWPRSANAQYIYGSGLAVFAKLPNGENRNFYTYIPSTSSNDFVTGSFTETNETTQSKYRVYNSRDYDKLSGIAIHDSLAEYRWPIWLGTTFPAKTYGNYVIDPNERSRSVSKPNFRADEEMVSISKIDDSYPLNKIPNPKEFEDMRLDIETRTYNYEEIPDVLFVSWVVHNRGAVALEDIAFAPVYDIDINRADNRFKGVDNDIMLLPKDSSIAVFATEISEDEAGTDFGYIAFDWFTESALESKDESQNLNLYSYYDFNLNTDYSAFDFMDHVNDGVQAKSVGEQSFFSPTHRFDFPAGSTVRLTMQIMFTHGGDDYPDIEEDELEALTPKMSANWDIFKSKVLTSVKLAGNNSIEIYPNPASNHINIGPKYVNQVTEIISLTGKVLLTSEGTDKIDIRKLTPGVYVLKIGEKSQKFVIE